MPPELPVTSQAIKGDWGRGKTKAQERPLWTPQHAPQTQEGPEPETKGKEGASLVVQWLRICLPMQGTRVRALVWEDPTCRGATRPVSHNC